VIAGDRVEDRNGKEAEPEGDHDEVKHERISVSVTYLIGPIRI
jgi:hypothetical protein